MFSLYSSSPSEAELILLASRCAKAVYNSTTEPTEKGFSVKRLSHVSPTLNGVVKATSFHSVDRDCSFFATDPLLPALVISIRGTSRTVDWLVNLNNGLQDASQLLGNGALPCPLPLANGFSAHAGFANGAAALESTVTAQIRSSFKHNKVKHVIFTGHSAGGAVASLLFLRSLSIATRDCMMDQLIKSSNPI